MSPYDNANYVIFLLFFSEWREGFLQECLPWAFVTTSGIRAQASRLDPRFLFVRMSEGNDVVVLKAPRNTGDSFPSGGFLILSKMNYFL